MARKWEIRTWRHQRSNFTFSLNLKCSKMPASLNRLKSAYDFHLFWNIGLQNLVWKFWRIRWDCLILLAPQPGLPWSYLARPGQSNIRQFRWFLKMYWNSKELDGTDQYLVGSIWQSRPDRENLINFENVTRLSDILLVCLIRLTRLIRFTLGLATLGIEKSGPWSSRVRNHQLR